MTITPDIRLLTSRQVEILDMAAHGLNPSQIGKRIYMERRHVVGQLKAIQNVIGAKNLDQAIKRYREWSDSEESA